MILITTVLSCTNSLSRTNFDFSLKTSFVWLKLLKVLWELHAPTHWLLVCMNKSLKQERPLRKIGGREKMSDLAIKLSQMKWNRFFGGRSDFKSFSQTEEV